MRRRVAKRLLRFSGKLDLFLELKAQLRLCSFIDDELLKETMEYLSLKTDFLTQGRDSPCPLRCFALFSNRFISWMC